MARKKKRAKGAKPGAAKGSKGSPGKAKAAKKTAPAEPEKKAQPNGKEQTKQKPKTDLTALRKKAEEAKAGLDKTRKEADALRAKAKELEAAAKKAYAEVFAPYRDACRKAGVKCELPGIKAPSTLPRARFLIERVKGGLKVTIKDRPKTEETIPDKTLADSVSRAARPRPRTQVPGRPRRQVARRYILPTEEPRRPPGLLS